MTEPFLAFGGLVRVYPAAVPDGTGLVWVHGGAFAGGDLDMPESDAVARVLSERGTTVVAVDYRVTSQGYHYPAPSDDVIAAWEWSLRQSARLLVDPARLALGGASAGGNLAAGAVLRLIDREEDPLPRLVILAYPTMLDAQPTPSPALRAALDANPDADVFGPTALKRMYVDFLGDALQNPPIAAIPGLATVTELERFPPTLFINSDIDELRVSAEVFAASLIRAGRRVTSFVEEGTTHGHLNRPRELAFAASVNRIIAALHASVS